MHEIPKDIIDQCILEIDNKPVKIISGRADAIGICFTAMDPDDPGQPITFHITPEMMAMILKVARQP